MDVPGSLPPERWDKEWQLSGVEFDKDGNPVFLYHNYETSILHLFLKRFKELGNTKQIQLIEDQLRARNN